MKKIALCQLTPIANRPDLNFKKMQESIKYAATNNAVLCIFPEDFLYGILRSK